MRVIPCDVSVFSMIRSPARGEKKDGQPQCDSNFWLERNSSAPQARQEYTPSVVVSVYSPTPGGSVPACRRT